MRSFMRGSQLQLRLELRQVDAGPRPQRDGVAMAVAEDQAAPALHRELSVEADQLAGAEQLTDQITDAAHVCSQRRELFDVAVTCSDRALRVETYDVLEVLWPVAHTGSLLCDVLLPRVLLRRRPHHQRRGRRGRP